MQRLRSGCRKGAAFAIRTQPVVERTCANLPNQTLRIMLSPDLDNFGAHALRPLSPQLAPLLRREEHADQLLKDTP
jgi:hypothetical protein